MHIGVLGLWCYRSSAVPYNGVPRNNTAAVTELTQILQPKIIVRVCECSGGQSPACLRRGPVLILGQYVWELMWTEWHWDRLFLRASAFPCHYYYTIVPHSFICLSPKICNLSNSQRLKVKHLSFPFSHSVYPSLTSHLRTRTDPVSDNVCPCCAIQEGGQSPDANYSYM